MVLWRYVFKLLRFTFFAVTHCHLTVIGTGPGVTPSPRLSPGPLFFKQTMKCINKPKKRCEDIVDFFIKSDSALKELNIKTLAAKYGLNRSYLVRSFKKYTGKDLRAYMNRLKMLKASVLLICKPNLKIWQIEESLGWRTGSFRIAFKKFFGVNPGYFRKHFKF
jgi:YesN/AraC family two-component response regulator